MALLQHQQNQTTKMLCLIEPPMSICHCWFTLSQPSCTKVLSRSCLYQNGGSNIWRLHDKNVNWHKFQIRSFIALKAFMLSLKEVLLSSSLKTQLFKTKSQCSSCQNWWCHVSLSEQEWRYLCCFDQGLTIDDDDDPAPKNVTHEQVSF